MTTINNKLKGMLWGGVVADALGVPYEFDARGNFEATGMTGFGTYNMPVGSWSDDSTMTLCLVENMLEGGEEHDLMKKFANWYLKGYMTPTDRLFDIGNITTEAIERYLANPDDASAWGARGEYSNGNGALMRISPLVPLLKGKNVEEKYKLIQTYTALTHAHTRSVLANVIYLEILYAIIFENAELEASVDMAKSEIVEYIKVDSEIESQLTHFERILENFPELLNLPEPEIASDGYVVHTLEAALWCVGNSQSYRDTVLHAVNLGSDTDTTADVAGSLSGALYGFGSIPTEWIDVILKKDELSKLIDEYAEYYAGDFPYLWKGPIDTEDMKTIIHWIRTNQKEAEDELRAESDNEFLSGRALAYYEVIDGLRNRLLIAAVDAGYDDIDYKALGFDD
jgi:ADP-ribosylglycohydrolase